MTDIAKYETPIETVHAETIPNAPEQPQVTFTVNPNIALLFAGVITIGIAWLKSNQNGRKER